MDCTPAGLIDLATCVDKCVPAGSLSASQIAAACAWANGTAPPVTLPDKPINPNPANGATGVLPYAPVLSWANGGGATSYDVWFNGSFIGNQAGTMYALGALAYSAGYAWRIDAVNAAGTTTGDVWTFSTAALPPFSFNPPNVVIHWTDSGGYKNGNLATFQATADVPTVTIIAMQATNVNSISNLSSLPALVNLDCSNIAVTTLDASGCKALMYLTCHANYSMTSLKVSGCTALTNLDLQDNAVVFLDVSSCTALVDLVCAGNVMSVKTVNDIFVALLANGKTGGTADTSQQAPPAPPSGAGAAAVIALQAEVPPWVITTD